MLGPSRSGPAKPGAGARRRPAETAGEDEIMAEYKKKKGIKVTARKPRPAKAAPPPSTREGAETAARRPSGGEEQRREETAGRRENIAPRGQRPAPQQEKPAGRRTAGGPRVRPTVPVRPFTGDDDFSDITPIPMEDSRKLREKKRIRELEKPPVKRMPARRAPEARPAGASGDRRAFQVVKGGKTARRVRLFLSVGLVAALALTLVILHCSAPVGLVEWVQNAAAAAGGGDGYPLTLADGQATNLYAVNGRVLVLSDTLLACYNKKGKEVYVRQHGFADPVVTSSVSRTLVYDRGGTGIKIYNDNAVLEERKLENNIMTAAVGRNGVCAFVTQADGYAAQISVVDKDFGGLYNWWSAEELISAVAVSDNGRRVAAAGLRASGGQYAATLYIFDLSESAPVAALPFGNDPIVALESPSGDTFAAVTASSVSTVKWDSEGEGAGNRIDYTLTGRLRQAHTTPDGLLLVTGRADDETAGRISLLDEAGTETAAFPVEGNLKSAAAGGGYIYCLFDHAVKAYAPDGTQAGSWECGYAAVQLAAGKDGTATLLESGRLVQYGPPKKQASSTS